MASKLAKDWYRWLIWIVTVGVLYLLGSRNFHLTNMGGFLIIIVVLPFLMLLAFWLLRDRQKE